ncbi:MAG: hypothetical protein QXH42_01425 [Thermoplasmata archaeon]
MTGMKPRRESGVRIRAGDRATKATAQGLRLLDRELERLSAEEIGRSAEDITPAQRERVMRGVLEIFFNIWIRFAVDLGRELRMSPWQWDFVIYEGRKRYRFRDGFNFSALREASLEESVFPYRHTLKAELRRLRGRTYVQVAFVLEEGRDYLRSGLAGAKGVYTIYVEEARRFSAHELKRTLMAPLRAWMRSEVLADPSILWDFCHRELRRGGEG